MGGTAGVTGNRAKIQSEFNFEADDSIIKMDGTEF
jgi:inosine-uridine nucleoside N-ribohydrolase